MAQIMGQGIRQGLLINDELLIVISYTAETAALGGCTGAKA